MKKEFIAAGTTLLLCAFTAQAGLLTVDSTYEIRFKVGTEGGSCFSYGNCDSLGGYTSVTDNGLTVEGLGSGIAGDGFAAVMTITADSTGDGFTVNSFNQDSYIDTAMGTFALFANDTSQMFGTLDQFGNMIIDNTGRLGIGAFTAAVFGSQPWNLDTAANGDGTGTQDIWTTGTQTANTQGTEAAFDMTGVQITGNDASGYAGQLVAAGNIGTDWGLFAGTQYSERFDIMIVQASPVPIPAASWLFGSGILGLVGAARKRRK